MLARSLLNYQLNVILNKKPYLKSKFANEIDYFYDHLRFNKRFFEVSDFYQSLVNMF